MTVPAAQLLDDLGKFASAFVDGHLVDEVEDLPKFVYADGGRDES